MLEMSKQKSIASFFSPTSEPLQVQPRPTAAPAPKKRRVGRPRKNIAPASTVSVVSPVDLVEYPTSNPPVVSSTDSAVPTNPVVPPADPTVPEEAPGSSSVRSRYSIGQKKKVASYARFHGGRAAAKHFKIHHKNVW